MDPLIEMLQDVRSYALKIRPRPVGAYYCAAYPPETIAEVVARCPRLHPYVIGTGEIEGYVDIIEEELVNAIGPVVTEHAP